MPAPSRDRRLAQQQLAMMLEDFDGDHDRAMAFLEKWAGLTLRFVDAESVERLRQETIIESTLRLDPSKAVVRRMNEHFPRQDGKSVARTFKTLTGVGLEKIREAIAPTVPLRSAEDQ